MSRSFLRPLSAALVLLPLLAAAGCRETGETQDAGSTSSSSSGGGGAGGAGGAGGGDPGAPLVVMTWNTRNFFNDVDDSAAAGEDVVSTAAYLAKRAEVASVIQTYAPDVVVVQEVENLGILQAMNDADLGGAYPHAALIESDDPRGIDIGALSRIPFDDVVSHKDDTFTKIGTQGPIYTYARDCLELHITQDGRRVILLGVHFRSKGPPDDADKRLAEAQHTRAIADALAAADPEAGIAVLGDFNDLTGSPPFLAIAGSGDAVFDDVAGLIPEANRWTFNFNGTLELIDHQMANPLLRAMLDEASVQIPHTAMVTDASDHAPIVATYRIKPLAP